MTVSRTRAARSGTRRPCSQSCTARASRPNRAANLRRLSFMRLRSARSSLVPFLLLDRGHVPREHLWRSTRIGDDGRFHGPAVCLRSWGLQGGARVWAFGWLDGHHVPVQTGGRPRPKCQLHITVCEPSATSATPVIRSPASSSSWRSLTTPRWTESGARDRALSSGIIRSAKPVQRRSGHPHPLDELIAGGTLQQCVDHLVDLFGA